MVLLPEFFKISSLMLHRTGLKQYKGEFRFRFLGELFF